MHHTHNKNVIFFSHVSLNSKCKIRNSKRYHNMDIDSYSTNIILRMNVKNKYVNNRDSIKHTSYNIFIKCLI